MAGQQGSKTGHRPGPGARRDTLPALSDDPIMERLDAAPPQPPKSSETPHDKARRVLISHPGQWMVLNARAKLSEATARRLARSYQRAKPSRLVEQASGRFSARPFVRDATWLVAAVYESEPVTP